MLDSQFHCSYIESREVPEIKRQKPCEKKAREIWEKSGEKYLPFISGTGSRLPVMQLLVMILHTIPHKYDRHGAHILLSSM
jgi:hypothetical protein